MNYCKLYLNTSKNMLLYVNFYMHPHLRSLSDKIKEGHAGMGLLIKCGHNINQETLLLVEQHKHALERNRCV